MVSEPTPRTWKDLEGRVALITGAAQGIGLALAQAAVGAGMRVAVVDLDEHRATFAARRLRSAGGVAEVFTANVASLASMTQLVSDVEESLGSVWLCCNNAGRSRPGTAWQLTEADWASVLGVNLGGVVNAVQTFLPGMVARNGGHMVNVASIAGLVVAPGRANYTASKHAVVGLSEAVYRDLELVGSDVGITVVCPGPVATRRWTERPTDRPELIISPNDLAHTILQAVLDRQFWVLPQVDAFADAIRARTEGALSQADPTPSSADPVLSASQA